MIQWSILSTSQVQLQLYSNTSPSSKNLFLVQLFQIFANYIITARHITSQDSFGVSGHFLHFNILPNKFSRRLYFYNGKSIVFGRLTRQNVEMQKVPNKEHCTTGRRWPNFWGQASPRLSQSPTPTCWWGTHRNCSLGLKNSVSTIRSSALSWLLRTTYGRVHIVTYSRSADYRRIQLSFLSLVQLLVDPLFHILPVLKSKGYRSCRQATFG